MTFVDRSLQRQRIHKENVDVPAARDESVRRLQSRFQHVFSKYGRNFRGVGDEIDLATGQVVVDNGHLTRMTGERDDGVSRRLGRNLPRVDDDGWESMPEGDERASLADEASSSDEDDSSSVQSMTSSTRDQIEDRISQLGQTIAAGIADILSLRGVIRPTRSSANVSFRQKRDKRHDSKRKAGHSHKRRRSELEDEDEDHTARHVRRRHRPESMRQSHGRNEHRSQKSSRPRVPNAQSRHRRNRAISIAVSDRDDEPEYDDVLPAYSSDREEEEIANGPATVNNSRLHTSSRHSGRIYKPSGRNAAETMRLAKSQQPSPVVPRYRESERLETPIAGGGSSIWDPKPSPAPAAHHNELESRKERWTGREKELFAQLKSNGTPIHDMHQWFPHRSSAAINRLWAAGNPSPLPPKRTGDGWTNEESAELMRLKDEKSLTWQAILELMPHKSMESLKQQYIFLAQKSFEASADDDLGAQFRRWKKGETDLMLKLRRDGICYEDIGFIIGRTESAIKGRMVRVNSGQVDIDDTDEPEQELPIQPEEEVDESNLPHSDEQAQSSRGLVRATPDAQRNAYTRVHDARGIGIRNGVATPVSISKQPSGARSGSGHENSTTGLPTQPPNHNGHTLQTPAGSSRSPMLPPSARVSSSRPNTPRLSVAKSRLSDSAVSSGEQKRNHVSDTEGDELA